MNATQMKQTLISQSDVKTGTILYNQLRNSMKQSHLPMSRVEEIKIVRNDYTDVNYTGSEDYKVIHIEMTAWSKGYTYKTSHFIETCLG